MKTKGMTVLELLVTIAIVAVLSALLFPVVDRAKETKPACLSNVRQIVAACSLYAADNDDRTLATSVNKRSTGKGLPRWTRALEPYVDSQAVFMCPYFEHQDAEAVLVKTDYIMNVSMTIGMPLSTFSNLNSQIALSERADRADADTYNPWKKDHFDFVAKDRHGRGSVFAFADGHTKWMAFGQTIAPRDLHRVDVEFIRPLLPRFA